MRFMQLLIIYFHSIFHGSMLYLILIIYKISLPIKNVIQIKINIYVHPKNTLISVKLLP